MIYREHISYEYILYWPLYLSSWTTTSSSTSARTWRARSLPGTSILWSREPRMQVCTSYSHIKGEEDFKYVSNNRSVFSSESLHRHALVLQRPITSWPNSNVQVSQPGCEICSRCFKCGCFIVFVQTSLSTQMIEQCKDLRITYLPYNTVGKTMPST